MMVALLNAALPLLLAATANAAPLAPTVHLEADTIRADENGSWTIPFTLHNPGEYGLFGDSLFLDITVLDRGVSRTPRHNSLAFPFLIQQMGTVGAGEDKPMSFSLAAPCERAALVVRLYLHGGGHGPAYAFRETLTAEPGALTAAMPSTFVTARGNKQIECLSAPASASGPVPGLLLVPAETAHARLLARTAVRLAARGMNVVVVSPPGYGQSDGPADMAGPATLVALEAALARLVALPGTDRARLAVWGTGRGATAALLLAARHPEIARVVAQDAGYDLWATWRAADATTAANIVAEAGSDSAGWKARSPLLAAARVDARVLVLQGVDPGAPVDPARAFVAARLAGGAPVDTVWAAPGTHRLRKDGMRAGIEFLMAPARP